MNRTAVLRVRNYDYSIKSYIQVLSDNLPQTMIQTLSSHRTMLLYIK